MFERLQAEIASITPVRKFGRVVATGSGVLHISGLSRSARLGDRVEISSDAGQTIGGEVLRLSREAVVVLPDTHGDGIAMGDRVELLGFSEIAPDSSWIGRIVNPFGQPLDGRPLLRGAKPRALRASPPSAASRGRLGARLRTGLAVFDTLLPIVQGQRIGLFSGSGVGKSSLLGKFAQGVEAEIVVVALIGERGRELRDFIEDVLGPDGMARAIVVTATSDESPLLRRRCAWAAMAIAEHFRDLGAHVLLLADSITRFAEAHREIALAAGEEASLRGYPPSTSHMIMSLAERAGPGAEGSGAITAVFTVLVAGSDMEEPIADILRGVLDGHVVLDRAIAERGRFPAVDVLRSVSRSLPAAATPSENARLTEARRLLGAYDRAELMIQAGLYEKGSDPLVDRAVRVWPALDAFVGLSSPDGLSQSYAALAKCLDT
jgi:flagellum-specific ATP synthase